MLAAVRPMIEEKVDDTDVKSLKETMAKYRAKGFTIVTPRSTRWRDVPEAIREIAEKQSFPFVAVGHTVPAIAISNDSEDLPGIARVCNDLGWKLDCYHLG